MYHCLSLVWPRNLEDAISGIVLQDEVSQKNPNRPVPYHKTVVREVALTQKPDRDCLGTFVVPVGVNCTWHGCRDNSCKS